jgi:NADP-dependent 3-hydroxy acid dehydrogenase YdfG
MPVFFITGCSSGFGTEIAKAALHAGHKVVATSRNVSKLGHLKELGAHTMSLDINGSDADIVKAVKEAEGVYGTIDVLVNNSGYIFEGAIEEAR